MNVHDRNPGEPGDSEAELDQFADRLARLKPSGLSAHFAHRLEMTLHRAEEELSVESRIVPFPVSRWVAAAAVLVLALALAFDSTLDSGGAPTLASEEAEVTRERAARPVYQVVNGRMVEVSGQQVMGRASYKGVRVMGGKAYHHYQHGDRTYWEPALASPADPSR